MYCKWCGMENQNDILCVYCGRLVSLKDIKVEETNPASISEESTGLPSEISPASREPLTRDVPPGTRLTSGEIGLTPPAPSVPTAPQFPSAIPGMAPTAAGHHVPFTPLEEEEEEKLPPLSERLLKYSGIMLIVLAVGIFTAHQFPTIWLVPLFVNLFVSGLLLGIFKLTDYIDNYLVDVVILLIPMILVGPIYGTVLFAIQGLVRKTTNLSIITLMVSYLVIRLVVGTAVHGIEDTLTYMFSLNLTLGISPRLMQPVPAFFLMSGWALADFTRPLNK